MPRRLTFWKSSPCPPAARRRVDRLLDGLHTPDFETLRVECRQFCASEPPAARDILTRRLVRRLLDDVVARDTVAALLADLAPVLMPSVQRCLARPPRSASPAERCALLELLTLTGDPDDPTNYFVLLSVVRRPREHAAVLAGARRALALLRLAGSHPTADSP
ncbi:MAG: hypothetical protein JNM56_33730 [Planctomycetia bacterium]|nr:hypothetical protein [Planctomycetia bacterium]